MRPTERDAGYLWDMLEASREAVAYAAVPFATYAAERMRQRAVERAVEIVGEAARHVSAEFKAAHPDVPWRIIVAQRHILAHEYGEVLQERIWRVATVHLLPLIRQLEDLVPPPPPAL